MSKTQRLIHELSNICPQPTAVAAILLAIRARMEKKAGMKNAIGKVFTGNRGVLFVGKAGVGKTRFMTKIYNGLGLSGVNSNGSAVGTWLPSTGGGSGVGMYQVLENFNDSIIFADELSLDTEMHVHVMKQIAQGKLCRPRNNAIDSVPFSGLLIGATNAVKLPGGTKLEHLVATLDRFMVVQARGNSKGPSEIFDIVFNEEEDIFVDWDLIAEALTRKCSYTVTEDEKTMFWHFWMNKCREILDSTRLGAQFRNTHSLRDIILFTKRFFGIKDLTQDEDARIFAEQMVEDCILFNPVGILNLQPIQQVIYDLCREREETATADIIQAVTRAGITVSRQTVMNQLTKMCETHLILRTTHGKYGTKRPARDVDANGESETRPSTIVQDLVNQL